MLYLAKECFQRGSGLKGTSWTEFSHLVWTYGYYKTNTVEWNRSFRKVFEGGSFSPFQDLRLLLQIRFASMIHRSVKSTPFKRGYSFPQSSTNINSSSLITELIVKFQRNNSNLLNHILLKTSGSQVSRTVLAKTNGHALNAFQFTFSAVKSSTIFWLHSQQLLSNVLTANGSSPHIINKCWKRLVAFRYTEHALYMKNGKMLTVFSSAGCTEKCCWTYFKTNLMKNGDQLKKS